MHVGRQEARRVIYMIGLRIDSTHSGTRGAGRAQTSVLVAMAKSLLLVTVAPLMVLALAGAASAAPSTRHRTQVLTTGLQGSVGSAIGPDGALYVTEAVAGRVSRVDLRTGRTRTYASGLPKQVLPGLGGAMDVAFLRGTAYVLVTLVSPDVGGNEVDGVYRVDGPHRFTVVADLGAWSLAHPPATPFFVPTGVQYALQAFRGGLLVTDGHHNRVLGVSLRGDVSEVVALPNVVPTGLATRGNTVLVAQAGPAPHLPQEGKVLDLAIRNHSTRVVASGAPLLVDVEFGYRGRLYALSQGRFTPGHEEGSPADPNTGALCRVEKDGTMTPVVSGLNQPTSLEIIGNTAYVVTLTGDIVVIQHLHRPHATRG
jgi:sugar lactone lactonase YvrE